MSKPESVPRTPNGNGGAGFRELVQMAGPAFFPLAFFARLPLAMLTVGSLTLVASATGSYALGGLSAAMVGLGSAFGGPLLGYLADRLGQRPVLLPLSVLNPVAILALMFVGGSGTDTGLMVLVSLLCGALCPQVGPLARVRWMAMTAGRPNSRRELSSALSYEGTADELTFVMGPALVGLLAASIAPWLPLAIAAAMTLLLVPLFALHHSAVHSNPVAGASAAAKPTGGQVLRVGLAVAGMIGMGTYFGSMSAGTIAFAGALGNANAGGLLYAAMGLTSACAALSVAFWPQSWPQANRWMLGAVLLFPLVLLLHLPTTLAPMVVVLLLVGMPVGPIMVTIFTIGGAASPAGRLGTVMTMLSSGVVIGTAIGNGLAGMLADSVGFRGAYWVAAGAALLLLAAGLGTAILHRLDRRSEKEHPTRRRMS